MSYCWFNGQGLLIKAKEKHDNKGRKEKAAEYCKANKEVIKEKKRKMYKT